MKARQKRLSLVLLGLSVLALGAWLVLSAFQKNLVFGFTPRHVRAVGAPVGRSFRVGGMGEAGSLRRQADGITSIFVVTDMAHRVTVRYRGLLPDLFKEGKGVVAQGKLGANLLFVADEVLAKHDENYMPPEAAHALKQAADRKAAAEQKKGTP